MYQGLTPLEILVARFKGRGWADDRVVLLPDVEEFSPLADQAQALGIKVSRFEQAQIVEKPLVLRQQRWNLEDDSGNDTWVGAAFARVVSENKWNTAVLVPLVNLLIDPEAVTSGLKLHRREAFDLTAATELISGAAWYIFEADLLNGLMNSHADLMWARGGLAWAIRKPLYPFKVGAYHCPRVRSSINVDLRLNSQRAAHAIAASRCENFVGPEFSYEDWLISSAWEAAYCDFAPQAINVEPANLCNAGCYACVYPQMQRPKTLMTLEIFSRLSSAFKPGDDCRWVFSGMGEPLLNPFLGEMVRATGCFSSMLLTSLQKLPPEGFPFSALDQVRISTDALAEEDFLKKRPGCSWKNIELFLNIAHELKTAAPDRFPELGISCVRHALTESQMQLFINYWKQVVRPVFRENFFRWPFESSPEQVQWYQILGEAVFAGARARSARVDFEPVRRRPCRHALLSTTILSDGRVTICPYDFEGKYAIGDLKVSDLREIWASEAARVFRSRHLELKLSDHEPCAKCSDWYHPF
ncbi:MAG: SPASM domain-containing protein [Candidatus Riflebacteria bacterium]|nr:SPASM domain-containing protein [Candidatus Riflebacteria bacterium]